MKPKKSKNSKKSRYVRTTSGVTYRLGHRLMERVDRRTHQMMECYHFMTRYDLQRVLETFQARPPFRARVYMGDRNMSLCDFPVGWDDGGLFIGCMKFSATAVKTLTKWANGNVL